VKEPPITFLPGLRLFTPQLFTKVFTDQRMRIKLFGEATYNLVDGPKNNLMQVNWGLRYAF